VNDVYSGDTQKRYGYGLYPRFIKRVLDIILGVVALPFFGLSVIIVAAFIKREDKGPIFYNAPRIGRDGRSFIMYKYRTMYVGAPDLKEPDGSTYSASDDPRHTKIGAVLRQTSIDELPQVLNVLRGDMSFIGPRPDLIEEVELYGGEEPLKLKVRPGISGYAQVHGRNAIAWRDRLALDVIYVKQQSFLLDTKVFFKTLAVVFKREGIY